MQRTLYPFGITLLLLLLFVVIMSPGMSQDHNQYDESFDPLKLKEPKSTLFKEHSQQEVARQIASDTTGLQPVQQESEGQQMGYRVQLILTPNYQEADSMLSKVRDMFAGEANAYWVYDSPNYKIQIGDCQTRNAAEQLKQQAQRQGFRFSWVVPSTINPEAQP
ncbi:MAG TPA: SPOR domain-containing protein [bacterium]|nr:SPOR domain-containing protein [bacterium]